MWLGHVNWYDSLLHPNWLLMRPPRGRDISRAGERKTLASPIAIVHVTATPPMFTHFDKRDPSLSAFEQTMRLGWPIRVLTARIPSLISLSETKQPESSMTRNSAFVLHPNWQQCFAYSHLKIGLFQYPLHGKVQAPDKRQRVHHRANPVHFHWHFSPISTAIEKRLSN